MKEYTVLVPITGYISMTVEAENEDEAIDQVFQDASLDDVEEWDMHKSVLTGNVSYALLNEMRVIEE